MLLRISRINKLALVNPFVIAVLCGLSGLSMAQSDVCVPSIGGLSAAPTIDGVVEGDPGWNKAVRLNLKEILGTPRVGSMQLGRAGNFLYISLEVEGTPTPAYDDLVVLGFSTTTSAAQDWRVHIHPFTSDDVGSGRAVYQNDDPRTRDYWRNSDTWNLNTTATPIAGTANTPSTPFIGEVKVSRNANNWAMEMKIPTSSSLADAAGNALLYLPPSSPTTFKLYVNVLSTFDLYPTVIFTQDPWPHSVAMLTAGAVGSGGDFAANRTPAPGTWATASIFSRSECNGVYLASNSSVGVRQTTTGAIGYSSRTGPGPFTGSAGPITTVEQCETGLGNNSPWPAGTTLPNNYFVAKPGNDGPLANRVYVKFYVAPWGIPGAFDAGTPNAYWHPLGELYQPTGAATVHSTTPEATIPTDVDGSPALAAPLSTPSWQLSYKQACVYTKSNYYGSVGHHCIQADVRSNDPSVVIRNKSIQINHNFVEASVASREAKISVKGRGKPAERGKPHEMILFSHKVVQTYKRDGPAFYAAAIKGDVKAASRKDMAASVVVPAQFRALGPVPAERFPKGIDEGMTVTTNGYLNSADSMIIGSKRYRYAQYVGGYSYFAGHAGAARDWSESVSLSGGGTAGTSDRGNRVALEPLGNKVLSERAPKALPIRAYALQIEQDDSVTLAIRAEAQEQEKCRCGDLKCLTERSNAAGSGDAFKVAGMFLSGVLGVGGVAFVRKRKPKPGKSQKRNHQN